MFDRVLAFLKELPALGGDRHAAHPDDARVAASALLYHVMTADGVRQDVEWDRFKRILADTYGLAGRELDALASAGEEADNDAVDLYAFTSVLRRSLDGEARKAFVELMWELVYADGQMDELEDNTVWRIAELLDVENRDRVEARIRVARRLKAAAREPEDR